MKILFLSNTIDPTSGGYGRYTYDLQRALKHAGEEATSLPEFLGAELSDPFAYLTKPFLFLRDYRSIRRAILQHQPNIVHITFEPYALLVPLLPLGKAKVFLTVHGTYAYAPSFAPFGLHWLYRILFARALARLSGIVAVSDYTKQHLLRQAMRDAVKLSADFITTVHNGISMSTYGNNTQLTSHE